MWPFPRKLLQNMLHQNEAVNQERSDEIQETRASAQKYSWPSVSTDAKPWMWRVDYVHCTFNIILYAGLKHPQSLVSAEAPGADPLGIQGDDCKQNFQNYGERKFQEGNNGTSLENSLFRLERRKVCFRKQSPRGEMGLIDYMVSLIRLGRI